MFPLIGLAISAGIGAMFARRRHLSPLRLVGLSLASATMFLVAFIVFAILIVLLIILVFHALVVSLHYSARLTYLLDVLAFYLGGSLAATVAVWLALGHHHSHTK